MFLKNALVNFSFKNLTNQNFLLIISFFVLLKNSFAGYLHIDFLKIFYAEY